MDAARLLAHIPLFAGVPADQLLAVAEITERVSFGAGEVVFHEGEAGHHLYLVVSGTADVVKGSARVAGLGPGDCFGEVALIDRSPRTATVRAVGDLECLVLARDDFDDLLAVSASLARSVIRVLSRRLRELS